MENTTTCVLYRKLSLKSQLKFGRYREQTVGKLIELGLTDYLWYCYYCLSNIDFLPEVKERLGITKFINKPGTAPEVYEERKKERREFNRTYINKDWDDMTPEEQLLILKKSAIKKRNQRIEQEKAQRAQKHREYMRELSPAQLQALNHNHGFGRKTSMPKAIK